MKVFDLYVLPFEDLEEARAAVEQALGIRLEPHESLHRGDYYLLPGYVWGEEFELVRNFDPFYEEAVEDQLPENTILLYYSSKDPERARAIEQILIAKVPGTRLWQRNEL